MRKKNISFPNLLFLPGLKKHTRVFVIGRIVRRLQAAPEECFFWATHGGAELDLLVVRGRRRWGFEIKRTTAPSITPSMQSALADLRLKQLHVIHAGDHTFPRDRQIRAVTLARLTQDLD